mgnify:CR=1 FL=1
MAILSRLKCFWADEAGVLFVALLIFFPILLFAVGLAIDVTNIEAEKRYVQSQADLAAMTAIMNLETAPQMRKIARKTIYSNRRYQTLPTPDSQIQVGNLVEGAFDPSPNQNALAGDNAVRVEVRARGRYYFLGLFDPGYKIVVARHAVAIQQPRVSFSLSNCLLEETLLKPILQPLIGAKVNVLCSGRGIDSTISGQGFLRALSARTSLLTPSGTPHTYGDLLDTQLPASTVLSTALGIAVPNDGMKIRLSDVLYLSPDLKSLQIGQPLPPLSLSTAGIVLASAELLAERVATVNTSLNLPGIGGVQAQVTVGDPRQIVLGAMPGDPNAVARTSQIRVDLPAIQIAGLFDLSLSVHLANASAALTDRGDTCSEKPNDVVTVFDPVTASLANLGVKVKLLGLSSNLGAINRLVQLVAPPAAQIVSFTRSQARNSPDRSVTPDLLPQLNTLTSRIDGMVKDILGPLIASALPTDSQQQWLIKDALGLSIAKANLHLIYSGCPYLQRLAQ